MFLKKVLVKEEDAPTFNQSIDEFEENDKQLYKYGKHSFLKYWETQYFHMLRFYMPRIARDTWNDFHLGVGVSTIQGFERRQSESKYIFKTITNKRNNKTTNVVM